MPKNKLYAGLVSLILFAPLVNACPCNKNARTVDYYGGYAGAAYQGLGDNEVSNQQIKRLLRQDVERARARNGYYRYQDGFTD